MSTLTIILIIVVVLIAIPFIGGMLVSKEMFIEREIVINKPVQQVYDYLKILRNGEHFNKWVMADPNMRKDFSGTDGTVGFIYKWDSDNKRVGKGEQEIVGLTEGQRIDYELRFIKPYEGKSAAYLITEPAGGGTKVRFAFRGESNYMMRIMQFVLNIKKMLGNDLATSLNNLKHVLEK